jgi:hypothetical protein
MRLNKTFLILVLFAMTTFSLVCATNLFAAESVTITGTVYPAAWDENDNVTEVVITGVGQEYIVMNNAVGEQLLRHNGMDVKVTGILGKDNHGNRKITVTKYEIMMD